MITNKYSFKGKMKDGPISKLIIITETGHRPTQYKKVIDTIPVLYTVKNHQGLNDVIHNRINLVEMGFMPTIPDTDLWSKIHHVES